MLNIIIFIVVLLIVLGILSIAVYLNSKSYYNEDFERKEKDEK